MTTTNPPVRTEPPADQVPGDLTAGDLAAGDLAAGDLAAGDPPSGARPRFGALDAARPGPASRYGISQVIRSEVVKITTLRSTLWILLITLAGPALVTILSTDSVLHHSAQWYEGFDPTNQALAGALVGILTMGVFGVLMVTGEYANGTIRTSLSAQPRRLTFLAGKAVVAAAALLVAGEVLTFGCFFLGQAVLAGGGVPHASLGQTGVARAVLLSGVFLALFGLLGLALGVIIRSTAGALSAYVGVTFLLPVLLRQVSGQPDRFTPVQMLASSVSVTVRSGYQVSPGLALFLMLAYTTVLALAGVTFFSTRDA